MRVRAFLALLSACGIALAAEEDAVKAPHIESGDCWTYRAEGLENKEPIRSYEECVTFVDQAKDVILAVARINDGEREIETSYAGDWGVVVGLDGIIIPGGARYLRFPLRPGDAYSIEFEFRLAVLGAFAGRNKYDVKVVGWESVTVPAGTFRTLKIEARGTVQRYDIGATASLTRTLWYSPEVHRTVKMEFSSKVRAYRRELVKYRLNQ